MHFTTIASVALAIVATGLSAAATPSHLEVFPARSHGRRISRKMHLAARHGGGSTRTVTEYTTMTSYSGSEQATPTGADCAAPTTVTEYTTITVTETAGSGSSSEEPAPSSSTEEPSATTSDAPAPSSSNAPPSASGAVIVATGSQCGDPNGVPEPAATSGPNGDENWLNCGVDGNGWVPPPITLENLVYKDLAAVLQQDHNPFSSCAPYLDIFERLSAETGVPTIFLASIALQESGCNPSVTGGATEVGMMQITPDKCPSDGSDCYDPEINIGIGARYFKTVLDQNNGNLAAAMGNYNGWYFGLTVALANNYAVCAQHNNLDYLQNVFNGYLQGVDPSSLNMGIYHNTC